MNACVVFKVGGILSEAPPKYDAYSAPQPGTQVPQAQPPTRSKQKRAFVNARFVG